MVREKKHGFERVGLMYVLALSGIAIAIILSQVLVQQFISDQENDSRLLNLAGRQRMLSQKISKLALQIGNSEDQNAKAALRDELSETLQTWKSAHERLTEGTDSLESAQTRSAEIDSMYTAIKPYYNGMISNSTALVDKLRATGNPDSLNLDAHIKGILTFEGGFLNTMDAIVFQYDHEAHERVVLLRNIEYILLVIGLLIILFELLFIFRPTAFKIRKTIAELSHSEKLATDMSREIGALYTSLERSYQELAKVDIKDDLPKLFAKSDFDGTFTRLTEDMLDIIGGTSSQDRSIFQWLQDEGYSSQQIDRIQERVNSGNTWYGEVKATSADGDFVWLDTTIIPTLDETGNYDSLSIICSNKTARKEAEARSHEIIKEKIDSELKEQRIRSILILEGQEEERRRISRDIHDGIGQLLTALKFTIENINLKPNMTEREIKVREAQKMLNHVIREVRRVSFNLNPSALSDYGLSPVTRRFCSEVSKMSEKNVIFDNKTGFLNRLDKSVETNLYRIIQEAVNNAIKYSESDEIRVEFSHNAHHLNVDIIDNGIGFDFKNYQLKESKDGTGLGILNMQERAYYINGTIEFNSNKDEGTRISIHLPIKGTDNGAY